jgi:hypothetical protein
VRRLRRDPDRSVREAAQSAYAAIRARKETSLNTDGNIEAVDQMIAGLRGPCSRAPAGFPAGGVGGSLGVLDESGDSLLSSGGFGSDALTWLSGEYAVYRAPAWKPEVRTVNGVMSLFGSLPLAWSADGVWTAALPTWSRGQHGPSWESCIIRPDGRALDVDLPGDGIWLFDQGRGAVLVAVADGRKASSELFEIGADGTRTPWGTFSGTLAHLSRAQGRLVATLQDGRVLGIDRPPAEPRLLYRDRPGGVDSAVAIAPHAIAVARGRRIVRVEGGRVVGTLVEATALSASAWRRLHVISADGSGKRLAATLSAGDGFTASSVIRLLQCP